MLYPFMTRNDGTEITFSPVRYIDGKEVVSVCSERWSPEKNDFETLCVRFPGAIIEEANALNEEEIAQIMNFLAIYEPLYFRFARQGGIGQRNYKSERSL